MLIVAATFDTPELWNQYLSEALAVIREKNPTGTVIIGPAFWNSVDHLKELQLPADDRHLIVHGCVFNAEAIEI